MAQRGAAEFFRLPYRHSPPTKKHPRPRLILSERPSGAPSVTSRLIRPRQGRAWGAVSSPRRGETT